MSRELILVAAVLALTALSFVNTMAITWLVHAVRPSRTGEGDAVTPRCARWRGEALALDTKLPTGLEGLIRQSRPTLLDDACFVLLLAEPDAATRFARFFAAAAYSASVHVPLFVAIDGSPLAEFWKRRAISAGCDLVWSASPLPPSTRGAFHGGADAIALLHEGLVVGLIPAPDSARQLEDSFGAYLRLVVLGPRPRDDGARLGTASRS
jgi:hypothetical protein